MAESLQSEPHQRDLRSSKSKEAIIGAFILVLKKLEWNLITENIPDEWNARTGIAGAANNEIITLLPVHHGCIIVSESIGETAFHEAENENNTALVADGMKAILADETDEKLTGVYNATLRRISNQNSDFFTWSGIAQMMKDQFMFRDGGSVTIFLVMLNMAVFAAMAIAGYGFFEIDNNQLIRWGGNYTMHTLSGEYWRLLTNTFLHGGFSHLVFNLYGLFIGGLAAEELLGKRRFLIAYITSGIFASSVSLIMHDEVLSVGASGAIFGCFGLVLGVASTKTLLKSERNNLLMSFGIFVVLSLVSGLKGNIDNWAHLGGLACGWAGGFLWALVLKRKERVARRRAMDFLVPGAAIAISAVMVWSMPDSLPKYEDYLVQYDQTTLNAFKYMYDQDGADSADVALLKDSGMYFVKKGGDILNAAYNLPKLPKERRDFIYKIRVLNDYRYKAFYYTFLWQKSGDLTFKDSLNASVEQYKEMEKIYFGP